MNDFNLRKFLIENKLTPQSLLFESEEDEYNVSEPSPEWNARELEVGSKISVDDFKPEIIASLVDWGNWLKNQPPHVDIFKNGFIVTGIKYKDKYFVIRINGTGKYLTYFFDELDPNKVTLVSESMFESDEDDFANPIEASPEWGAQELTVGSTITPDMWVKNEINIKVFPELFEKNFKITKVDEDGFFINPKVNAKYGTTTAWKLNFFSFDDLDPTKAYIVPQN